MKIKELLEFGVGRVTKQNQTQDVGPNEIKKQAAKFGFKVDKDGRPPLLHKTAARNSTPNKLMNLGLTESRGVTARVQGDQYVNVSNPGDILTIQEVTVLSPKNKNAFDSLDELEAEINNVIPNSAEKKLDNNPTVKSKAAIIAHVTDANNKEQYWVRYLEKIPDTTIHGKWLTLNGYKYKSERSSSETIAIKPSDIIMDEKFRNKQELAKTVKLGIRAVTQGTPDEGLSDVMNQAVDLAATGKIAPIKNGTPYATVISKYGSEYLGPLALLSGKFAGGDIKKAMDALEIDSFVGGQVRFSSNTRQELWDSLIKTVDGKQIQISTKMHTGGGAASSLAGIFAQITPEIQQEHPRAVKIMEYLAKGKSDEGVIRAAIEYNIIDEKTGRDILAIPRSSQNIEDVKNARLKKLINAQGVNPDALTRSDYRIFYHALAAVANKVMATANSDPDFSAAMLKSLNNNNYLQLITKTTVSGDSITLDYYGKFPTQFTGRPALYNKTYFATGQKGRIGFRLQTSSVPEPTQEPVSPATVIPKRKPADITAAKPRLTASPKDVGRAKR